MITFNGLLHHEQLEPAQIKLVRHQDGRYPGRPSPQELWRADDGRFDLYQRIQHRPVFDRAEMIASFVGTPLNESLFVGLYSVKGRGKAAAGLRDPVSGEDVSGLHFYELELISKLTDYRGRLVVKWGEGYRAWVQRAAVKDKPVIEIRRTVSDPPFPGFLDFCESLSGLTAVPQSWRVALSAVGGVYLLTSPERREQYVGSAHGVSGFWGRWENYVASGHGGNRRMREIPAGDYHVTVLEVASSTTSVTDLIDMENRWKRKLLTRKFGLNAN